MLKSKATAIMSKAYRLYKTTAFGQFEIMNCLDLYEEIYGFFIVQSQYIFSVFDHSVQPNDLE